MKSHLLLSLVLVCTSGITASAANPTSFELMDYFNPLVVGNEWEFTGTDYDAHAARRIERVLSLNSPVTAYTGRSSPHAYTTNLVRFNKAYADPNTSVPYDDWDEYLGTQGGISFWGDDDDSESLRADGGVLFPQTLKLGQAVSVTRDLYNNGTYLGPVTIQLTAVSWGAVTVPAGTFQDCLRIKLVISTGGQSDAQEEWWARGIGTVKHRNVPDDGEDQLDLVSYRVQTPPRITAQPRSTSAAEGTPVSLSVTATGVALRYQWQKNGADIPGQNAAGLQIPSMQASDVGNYTVVVANDYGSVTSDVAVLSLGAERLGPELLITSHADQQLVGGKSIVLSGTATDAGLGGSGIISVTVNGVRALNDTASGSGMASWSRSVTLSASLNTFTVVATDGLKNTTTKVIRVLSDPTSPVLTVSSPTPNQRVGDPQFTIRGRVTDSGSIAGVWFQFNSGEWTSALSANGWSDWMAAVTLRPGTNAVRVYAADGAGNRSQTNTVNLTYVVSAVLQVTTVGKGTLSPNLNGALLELGKSYKITATPAAGFKFTSWIGSVDGETLLSNNLAALTFAMRTNLALTATFVDGQKPILSITAPTAKQRWSNSVFTVTGTVKDNGEAGEVQYQLNGGEWSRAAGWSNWTATVNLRPGTNAIRTFAVDAAGNRSLTNTVNFTYVLTAPLTLNVVGNGKVAGAANGQLLEIDRQVKLTATPGKGHKLTGWLVQADDVTILSTNRVVPFLMRSNLVLTATFSDVTKPVLTIKAPAPNQRSSNSVFTVAGKVTDNGQAGGVQYQLNGGEWNQAAGWSNWAATVDLRPGTNAVRAYATDAAGNRSPTNTVNFTYVISGVLRVITEGKGTLSPNLNNAVLELGKSYKIAAAPAPGSKFVNWIGRVNGDVVMSTNVAALTFVMRTNLELTASFSDGQKPTISVTAPANGVRVTDDTLTARGTASDNLGVAEVRWRLNNGLWQVASGTTQWSAEVELSAGGNTFSAYAIDAAGNCSPTNTVTVTCLKDLVETYWPMHDGDWKTFTGPIGQSRIDFSGGPTSFSMLADTPDDTATSYYDYGADRREVRLTGGKYGWTHFSFEPDIVELTENLLLNGGTVSSSTAISLAGQHIPATVSVKVSSVGTVTVPAGTFADCKRADISVQATGYGAFSSEAYVLAPRVGFVRIGVYRASSSSFSFVGWQELTAGTVNGVDVRTLAGGATKSFAVPEAENMSEAVSWTPLAVETRDGALGFVGDRFGFNITGTPGQVVVVEGSSDLIHWTSLRTITIGDGPTYFSDPDSSAVGQRFYRVRTDP